MGFASPSRVFHLVAKLPLGNAAMVGDRHQDAASMFDEAMRLSPEYYELASENARRLKTLRTAGR